MLAMAIHQIVESLPLQPLSLFLLFLFIFIIYTYNWLLNKPAVKQLPSPPKLPFLGNLHQLTKLPHRSLRLLSQRYGELMLRHIGTKPSLVVSSANAAREIMRTHEVIFSNRPKLKIADKLLYGCNSITFSPYGEYWRQMKSISVLHLLNNTKVRSFRSIREEETALLVEKLKKSSDSVVNLSEFIKTLAKDIICRAAIGKKYTGKNEDYSNNFVEMLIKLMELLGVSSMGDLIPLLSWIDRLNGLNSRIDKVAKYFDEFLEGAVQERREHQNQNMYDDDHEVCKGENMKNFVDVLLEIQMEDPRALSNNTIKAVVLEMFAGGTDTLYTLLEWAMTELLRHPTNMRNLQEEIRQIVRGNVRVTESDLDKTKYLKAVIKETFRLHPPGPLLVFRESSQDVKINGYHIPAKTQVIINAWAIHRDPTFWEEAEEFRPERFLHSSVDLKGQHFHFIPFGAGRRGCPGMSFALISAELILATLMYEFDWKIPVGVESKALDVTETAGLTVHKRDPLLLIATPPSH